MIEFVSDDFTNIVRVYYKEYQISIAANRDRSDVGIQVYGKNTAGAYREDLSACFDGYDGVSELHALGDVLADVFIQIDEWEAREAATKEMPQADCLEKVMLVRILQQTAIQFGRTHNVISTRFIQTITSLLEKLLTFTDSVKTMHWKNLS